MVDCLYSVAIQAKSFHYKMVENSFDGLTGGGLTVIHCIPFILTTSNSETTPSSVHYVQYLPVHVHTYTLRAPYCTVTRLSTTQGVFGVEKEYFVYKVFLTCYRSRP